MRNLRLTTPKTTEQLIQQYSTPNGGGSKENTSFSSASSVTSENTRPMNGGVQIEAQNDDEDPNDMLYGIDSNKRARYEQY